MNHSPDIFHEAVRARRIASWVGVYIPLALTLIATALVWLWLPRLPDPAATHWGTSGGPDGFGPAATYLIMVPAVGFGMTLITWLVVRMGSRPRSRGALPVWSAFPRFMAAFGLGVVVFFTMLMLGTVAGQLDLTDAKDAPGVGWILVCGAAMWIVTAAAGWVVQPDVTVWPEDAATAEPIALRESERAVWIGEIRPSKAYLWLMGVTCLLLLGGTVLSFTADLVAGWVMLGTFVLVLVLLIVSAWFWVRIDDRGFEARSIIGWPVFRVPVADIERVEAIGINPLTDFGGWGMRWTPGRFGLVMRTGDGIVMTRKDGRIFGATLDDAETAASVLATAAARHDANEHPSEGGRSDEH